MPLGEKLFAATKTNLESTSDSTGVYTLYQDGAIIYIGRADRGHTIKSCLSDHKQGYEGTRTQRFTHYTREVTNSVAVRYDILLERHVSKYGHPPRCNVKICPQCAEEAKPAAEICQICSFEFPHAGV